MEAKGKWIKQVCPKAQIGLTLWGLRWEEDSYVPKEDEFCQRIFVTQDEIDRLNKEWEYTPRKLGEGAFTFPPGIGNEPLEIKLDKDWYKQADKFGKPEITYVSKWDKFLAWLTFGWFGREAQREHKSVNWKSQEPSRDNDTSMFNPLGK